MKPDTHSPDHARLGRAVRELRARRGLSQEELGFRAGLHRNYVGAIERGEINPTFRVLLKLERGLAAAALGDHPAVGAARDRHDRARVCAGRRPCRLARAAERAD